MKARPAMHHVVELLREHGLRAPHYATQLAMATARALGELLPDAVAERLRDALPPELAHELESVERQDGLDAEGSQKRMARALHRPVEGVAADADLVLRAIGEALAEELLVELERNLPERMTRHLRGPSRVNANGRSAGYLRTVHRHRS